ncbi:MAG TPA: C4-type zinc ribbon domain-containing protein [Thermoanaerobaculia bacterium]|nr:C4-type zinc ribbon domain-containing protein [Thermoanaerobaculia bacterium]
MNQHLEVIVELQGALDQLKAAEQRLHGIPDWMRELHEEHTRYKAQIEEIETTVEEAARERRASEAATADAQEKLKKYQQQINKVNTQREYGALLHEIDGTKGQITTSEEQAFAALERLEKAQRDLEARREQFRELEERYATEQTRWEGEKPAITAEAGQLRERIAALREQLPRGVLAQFERIRERMPSGALAPVRLMERPGKLQSEWHCGACNYRVRPQIVVEIRNTGSLVQCDSCKRILFIPPQEPVS